MYLTTWRVCRTNVYVLGKWFIIVGLNLGLAVICLEELNGNCLILSDLFKFVIQGVSVMTGPISLNMSASTTPHPKMHV